MGFLRGLKIKLRKVITFPYSMANQQGVNKWWQSKITEEEAGDAVRSNSKGSSEVKMIS
jgi:hypothetical protein